MPRRNPYKPRIELLIDLWDKVIRSPPGSREELEALLRRTYEEAGIEPLRGKARPEDLYDKELASLYVVGRYGLGIDADYPELFDKFFGKEEAFEEVARLVREGRYEEARRVVEERLGGITQNTLARILRVEFTKHVLGFIGEEEFLSLLRAMPDAFPDQAETLRKYARFYISFRVAEEIARGNIRSRTAKEAFKQALGVKLGISKSTPDDDYIASIAREVFRVPDKVCSEVLSLKRSRGRRGAKKNQKSQKS